MNTKSDLNLDALFQAARQPWLENPYGLISWLDMEKFSAALFVNIGSSLQWISRLVETGQWDENARKTGEQFSEKIAKDLRAIGCDISADAAIRFRSDLFHIFAKPETDLKPRALELKNIIFSEMKRHLFLWVPTDRARYYDFPADKKKWNETEKALAGPIATRFKKAATEIEAARRCYAVGQWTCCVFHLMRACEVGFKALYQTLDTPAPKLSASWGNMIKPMDQQLELGAGERYGVWAIYPDFFDQATNDLRAIKRVWRDRTMHIEADYDEDGAMKVLNAVTSFFVNLSEKLDQNGKVHA